MAHRVDARAARGVRPLLRSDWAENGVRGAVHHRAARRRRGARGRQRSAMAGVSFVQRQRRSRLVHDNRGGRLHAGQQLGPARALDRPQRADLRGRRGDDGADLVGGAAAVGCTMIPLASGSSFVDVNFLGTPGIISTAVLHGPGGVALIDPGPSSKLFTLRAELERAGIAIADVRTILLTHIHLDHAGATGTLVRENPGIIVYVHEKGAPHMASPEKLIASARRLWGDDMDRLWGEFLPVPAERMNALKGGERIAEGGRDLEVAYTPGHASHHVSYFSADSGIAFVGDTAGVLLHHDGFNMPPTPPPDIDLEAWNESLRKIGDWRADTLFITHFGPYT